MQGVDGVSDVYDSQASPVDVKFGLHEWVEAVRHHSIRSADGRHLEDQQHTGIFNSDDT